jgi:signal transduction histidine kinase/DNA-binding response OmpR family regulator/ligand-binding sensor domain-containing protein
MLVRGFKPRDYQGSPVVVRIAEHPASGELLLLAGSFLHVFDGTTWTNVQTNVPAIRCMGVDAAGRVWLAGVDQLGFCERDPTGSWRFQPLADRLPEAHRKLGRVWDCVVTADAVWFATETKAFRWQNDAFSVFTFPSTGTLLGAGGQLFFQVKNQALLRWDGSEFRELTRDARVSGASIMRLFAAEGGALEGVTSSGIGFRLQDARVEPLLPHLAATLGSTRLVSALPRAGGAGWYIGTENAGLMIVDRDGRLARRLTRSDGFVESPVADLAVDRHGALWAGTFSGPFQIEQPEAVTLFAAAQGMPEALSLGMERYQGRLYVSTPAGLLRLVPGRGLFEPTPGTPRYPQRLLVQPDGLIVAHSEGVVRLHDDAFTPVLAPEAAAVAPATSVAASRRDPTLLFVGRSVGLTVLRRELGGRTPARELRHFGDLGQVRDVIEDEDGAVWLATSTRGVHRIRPGSGADPWTTATITTFDTKNGRLAVASDSTMHLASPLGLLFHTAAGFARLDATQDKLIPETRFHFGDRVIALFGMTAVHGREAWVTASLDAGPRPPLFGRVVVSGADRGEFFPAPAAVQEALGPLDGGRVLIEGEGSERIVWARSVEGLVRIRPAALAPSPALGPVQFLRREASGAAQSLAKSPHPTRHAYSRQPYAFAFQSPMLTRGAPPLFQARLIGWDAQWSEPTSAREVRYSNLPAGSYRFDVRAVDRLGRVSPTASHAFVVSPPWWRSLGAFLGYAAALAAGVAGLVRWRVARVERDRRRLEQLVEQRTAELAAARDQAEAASRAKSAFLASMSHELRTPLNGVIGYAQVLQGDTRLLPDQQERLRIVRSSGEHLLRMINDVLDLAKIEAGKLELRPAPFLLRDLLRDTSAVHAAGAAAKGLVFSCDVEADLPVSVEGDAQKLRQVLDNLIGNAIKFTQRGTVVLRARKHASFADTTDGSARATLEFAVTDTGPGIAPTDRARLFQPFEQAAGERPNTPGTGLGLAISRALVERMGGTITLESTVGTGSTFSFTITLPIAASETSAPRESRHITGYEGPRRRVWIVDDHAVNRSLLVDLLQPLGFACETFASGEAALARLTQPDHLWPELAILDVRMAGLDGLELTRRLRALPRGGEVRVLLTSASVLTFDPAIGRAAGCDDFLPKPFRTSDLVEKIGRLLSLRWQNVPAPQASSSAIDGVGPAALPPEARHALQELLDAGDLEAFRAALERLRHVHPSSETTWSRLDTAASRFQLSELRQLLAQA